MATISGYKLLGFRDSLPCSYATLSEFSVPISSSLYCSKFSGPNFDPRRKCVARGRLSISHRRCKSIQQCCVVPRVSCLSEDCCEPEPVSYSNNSQQEATIDLKLPRRSLLVAFTCDACGTRSQRLINRLAYERGLVYIQCAGCAKYHKLVDNLGLVIEYNLQEETNLDTSRD